MNLEESDLYREEIEKNTRHRRSVMISIILCAFLILFLVILIGILKYQDSITEKLFINEKQVSLTNGFYKVVPVEKDDEKSDVTYIRIKDMATLLGYTYSKGEYNKFNEDEKSCYLQNDYEIFSLSSESDQFKKYIEMTGEQSIADLKVTMENDSGYNETFKLNYPIQFIDGDLYVSLYDITDMLNVRVDWQEYRFNFYSLEYMVSYAKAAMGKAGISQMSGYYENLRTVLYNYVVVGNGAENSESGLFGIVDFSGKEIVGMKYSNIKFAQNAKEFYVTTSNSTMGILNSDGSTKIAPTEFQEISLLDDNAQLYLVEKDGEYGVINKNGKIIIHAENDKIGFDASKFDLVDIENSSLLFGKCIPVEKDNKYGFYNTDGELILGINYSALGYLSTSSKTTSGNEENVLVIPSSVGINGIVISQNDLYGIFDANTESIILPCSYSKIYAITKSGVTTYYVELGDEKYELSEFLKENGLNNVDENGKYIDSSNSEEDNTQNKLHVETSNELQADDENQNNLSENENLVDEENSNLENTVETDFETPIL